MLTRGNSDFGSSLKLICKPLLFRGGDLRRKGFMIILIDNYDSFVHNLARYLRRLGQETVVVRNECDFAR